MSHDQQLEEICDALADEFQRVVDSLIRDPDFDYDVLGVDPIPREPAFHGDLEVVFRMRVATTNRAQLLGQVTPFDAGDYKGYYSSLFGGWLTGYVDRAFSLDKRFFVHVDAIPKTTDEMGSLDSEIALSTAIDEGIIAADGDLAVTMRDYGLESLVLGGGAVVAGPLPGPMQTVAAYCQSHDVDCILDTFCGSAAFAKIAIEHGASAATCIDLDLDSARANLEGVEAAVEFAEADIFTTKFAGTYDLAIADPYFHHLPRFIDRCLESYMDVTDSLLLTAGFREDQYWIRHIEDLLTTHGGSVERLDTGRSVQLLYTR